MAALPLSAKERARTVAALRKHGHDQKAIARELGISTGTIGNRVSIIGRAALEARAAGADRARERARSAAKKGGAAAPDATAKTAILEKRVDLLTKQLAAARGAGKPVPIAPRRVKIGREDLVRAVIPDSHGCFIDPGAAGAFLSDLKLLNPHEVVGLGDHIDAGGFLAQHHTWGYVAEANYTYEDDIKATNHFLDQVQSAAPRARIHYIEGNHESRVERWCVTETLRNQRDAEYLRSVFAPEVLLRLKERGISYYRRSTLYDNLPIPGTIKLGKAYFTHECGGGQHAAAHMVRRYGAPVVYGHSHRAQSDVVRTVSSGMIGAWNPGCLCRLQPLWRHTNLTDWSHGYGVQFVAKSGLFLHLNVPILTGGVSLLPKIG